MRTREEILQAHKSVINGVEHISTIDLADLLEVLLDIRELLRKEPHD